MKPTTLLGVAIALGLGACGKPAKRDEPKPPIVNPNPVLLPGPPQWMVVHSTDDLTFVVTTPTETVGEYRRLWLATIPLGKQSYSTTLYEFDCAQNRARTLQENDFTDGNDANRVEAVKAPQWLYPDSDLVIYHVLSHACGRELMAGAKFSSIKAFLHERAQLRADGKTASN